jgi:hypothetical protein
MICNAQSEPQAMFRPQLEAFAKRTAKVAELAIIYYDEFAQ